jgi:hypothetical protein
MTVIDAVDARAARRAYDQTATHADADSRTIGVKMTRSHKQSTRKDTKTIQSRLQLGAERWETLLRSVGADDVNAAIAATMEADEESPRFAAAGRLDFQRAPRHALFDVKATAAVRFDGSQRARVVVECIARPALGVELGEDLRLGLLQRLKRPSLQRAHVKKGVMADLH